MEAARRFLSDFKHVVTSGSGVDLVRRHDTKTTMAFLGFTKKNVEDVILGLSVANYCRGPEADRNMPGEVWEFGEDIEGYEVYIKLKLATVSGKQIAKCISFHISQRPLRYPYK